MDKPTNPLEDGFKFLLGFVYCSLLWMNIYGLGDTWYSALAALVFSGFSLFILLWVLILLTTK